MNGQVADADPDAARATDVESLLDPDLRIDPADIAVGDRVLCAWSDEGFDHTMTFTVWGVLHAPLSGACHVVSDSGVPVTSTGDKDWYLLERAAG